MNWDAGDRRTRKLFWIINYPTFLTDSWHFAKSLMIVLFVLAVIFYVPVINPAVDFIIMGAIWNLTFNVFYNKIFVSK